MPWTAGRVEISPDAGRRPDRPARADEAVQIEVSPRARVVVNERTGTVVIGGTVRLQPVSILHGGLSVNVIAETGVPTRYPFGGTTEVVEQTRCRPRTSP